MKAIPFFLDTIKIAAHSATDAKHLEAPVTIATFAEGEAVSLYELENGELMARTRTGRFVEGPEAAA